MALGMPVLRQAGVAILPRRIGVNDAMLAGRNLRRSSRDTCPFLLTPNVLHGGVDADFASAKLLLGLLVRVLVQELDLGDGVAGNAGGLGEDVAGFLRRILRKRLLNLLRFQLVQNSAQVLLLPSVVPNSAQRADGFTLRRIGRRVGNLRRILRRF